MTPKERYQQRRHDLRLRRLRLKNKRAKIAAGRDRARTFVNPSDATFAPSKKLPTSRLSGKNMFIGGAAAYLGYRTFSKTSTEDQISRMKGEREVGLVASATGAAISGATLFKAINTPFNEIIDKSTIRSNKLLGSRDTAGFLNKFKTPNAFLAGSIGLMAYGTLAGSANLATGENSFRSPLLATTIGAAGVMAYAHYGKNDFDEQKALKSIYSSIKEFNLSKGVVPIKGIKDWGVNAAKKFEAGNLISDKVPGSQWLNQALKHAPKSHIGKLAILGGGLFGVGQLAGVFDRESDIMMEQSSEGGSGQLIGYNASMARDSMSHRNEKRYRLSQRNSQYQEYQPRGAALV